MERTPRRSTLVILGLHAAMCATTACKSDGDLAADARIAPTADARGDTMATDATAADTTAPVFAGLTSAAATGETSVVLSWSAAADLITPSNQIVYRAYAATTSGTQSFVTPLAIVTGAELITITGLNAGTPYYFVVRAIDEAGNADANAVERTTTTLDTTPPTFAGVETALPASAGAIALTWNAASDQVSAAGAIRYRIYIADLSGTQTFGSPAMITAPGATGATITGLGSVHTSYVVVRAVDESGNEDVNTMELSATTPDTAPPSFAGVVSATPGAQSITLAWAAATDDGTAQSQIVYLIYQATSAGGESFALPSYATTAGATSFTATGLAINTTYYFVVRARDLAGNIDSGLVERFATTPSTDITPPVFAGVATATAATPSSVALTWTAATDNATAQSQIVYLVYKATSPGGESFTTPALTTVSGATTATVTGLAPGTTHYFVVRARDAAGNVDTNVVERNAPTPAATVSFANDVQPIFTANCATSMCHAGSTPAQGMDLSSGSAYSAIVNVLSGDCAGIYRVKPYAATQSYLMWKVQGSGACFIGSQMPKGSPPLSASDQTKIATWINEGTLDN